MEIDNRKPAITTISDQAPDKAGPPLVGEGERGAQNLAGGKKPPVEAQKQLGHDPTDSVDQRPIGATGRSGEDNLTPKPGSPTDLHATGKVEKGEETEGGFLKKAFGWLRTNVLKNPWVRGAVSVAAFFIPGLQFLSVLLFALDALSLLAKVAQGEKITLRDFLPVAAGAAGMAVDRESLLPATQLITAGWDLFVRYKDELFGDGDEVGLPRPVEDLMRLRQEAKQLAQAIEKGKTVANETQVIEALATEMRAIEARLDRLGEAEPQDAAGFAEQQKLNEHKRVVLVALGEIQTAKDKRAAPVTLQAKPAPVPG